MKKRHQKKRPQGRRAIRIGNIQMERAQATKTAPEAQFKRYRHLDVKLWGRNRQ